MSDAYLAVNLDDPADALDSLATSDREIARLLAEWREHTTFLEEQGDDVDVRWKRGSAAKLLLQHFAVRESAKDSLVAALERDGNTELAAKVAGDSAGRKAAISRFDEESRQRTGMNLNTPEVDETVIALGNIFDAEREDDEETVVPAVADAMGPSGERDLDSARKVRSGALTHPSSEPGVTEKAFPLRAAKAFYQHLRGTPSGGTAPAVDGSREHMPGPRS